MSEAPLYLLALPNSGRLSIPKLTCWVRGTGAPESCWHSVTLDTPTTSRKLSWLHHHAKLL